MKYWVKWSFAMSYVGIFILGNIFLNEFQYTFAESTLFQPSFSNNIEPRNGTLSILVVSIGASQRSQSMQRIIQELYLRGHRIRIVYPGTKDSTFTSAWNCDVEWISTTEDVVTSRKKKWMETVAQRESFMQGQRPTDSKRPRISKIPQFSESPVDYTLRLLWQEKSAWKSLNYLPKHLLFPLRHWLFDVIWEEIHRDRPDIIVADIGVLAAWDIADLLDIPLFLLYCGPLLPISSTNGVKDILLPPPLLGASRNATLLQIGFFTIQKWLYELHTSPALHKLNRLRWYQGLDSYRNIRDLFCRKHVYLLPTTFAFEIPRSLSSHYLLSGPIVSQCIESLPPSSLELAKRYSEQVVLINLEGAYLSRVTTLSIVNELHTLLIGFWWMNGSYVQPQHFPSNFYSLPRQLFGCALSNSMVDIVVVPCLSDVVQEVLYYGKPVLCIATGAVQLDVATRLMETHAGDIVITSEVSILDELTSKLQDMFGNLESYQTAAIEISKKIRMETCGLSCLCDAVESILYSNPVPYVNSSDCVDSYISPLLGRFLFYFAVAYVVGFFVVWFVKLARPLKLCSTTC
ncbi:hypothetical protein GpartN1_g1081.t1 [Galdieria partita]|uniref:Uncharacterized protein n=1 Tax=Galdieria partita TaxID=83374 RepID=A0A9C7PRP8_9RHOD|nr:hypothetical protein GpartN1_g1081.t1 [Galdieria partita]